MTNFSARIFSGLLFLVFSTFGLWWMRKDYKRKGKLTWYGTIVHVLIYAFHGMFCGTLVLGAKATYPPGRLLWPGILLMVIGLGMTLHAMSFIRNFSRWLGNATPGLYTNGLYRYSRNPQFIGYGLIILGFFLVWWNTLALIGLLSYVVLAYAVTLLEEEHLSRIYGASYLDYCKRVPRYFGFPKRR